MEACGIQKDEKKKELYIIKAETRQRCLMVGRPCSMRCVFTLWQVVVFVDGRLLTFLTPSGFFTYHQV